MSKLSFHLSASLFCMLIPLLLGAAPVTSAGARQVPVTPPARMPMAVKACYLKAKPLWDTGVTHDMIQGNGVYADCLEDLAVATLKSPAYDRQILEGRDPRQFLDQLLKQVDTLAWGVENQLKSCAPMCGTMWTVAASSHRSAFLEQLLQRMSERLLLESDQADLTDNPAWQACWKDPLTCQLK